MVKKIAIPVRTDFVFRTKFRQNPKTGLMEGRKTVQGVGDFTSVKRVSRDVDIDKDGDIDYKKGEIVGRVDSNKGRVYVKANKRQRAYRR